MSLGEENERLRFKVNKQQEDIDYLREVITGLKAEITDLKTKKKDSEMGR